MTETFISTARELCNYLPYLYVFMFLLCIGVQKQLSSLSITIILVACAEFIMDTIASPLLIALNDKSIAYEVRMTLWAMTWCYLYAGVVLFLNKSHHWLNVSKERVVRIVQLLFTALAALEMVEYINAVVFKTKLLAQLYDAGLPLVGLCISGYLLTQLLLSIKDHYVNRNRSASTAV